MKSSNFYKQQEGMGMGELKPDPSHWEQMWRLFYENTGIPESRGELESARISQELFPEVKVQGQWGPTDTYKLAASSLAQK